MRVPNQCNISSASLDFLLHAMVDDGGKTFNIFIHSADSKAIPHHKPLAVQHEINTTISHAGDNNNVRYARIDSIIFSTSNVQCASEICQLLTFLGVSIKHCVI